MRRAAPITDADAARLWANNGWPDWDYVPPDEPDPFERHPKDWGRLSDGHLVVLDYSATVD